MSKPNFTIHDRKNCEHGVKFEVFVDNEDGFEKFKAKHLAAAVPGSTVDIASEKKILRLLHDGTWEVLVSYRTDEEATAVSAVATE